MLTLSEAETVNMPQVCFPFVMEDEQQTLYEMMLEGKCLLGPGLKENATEKTRCIRLHRVSYTSTCRNDYAHLARKS